MSSTGVKTKEQFCHGVSRMDEPCDEPGNASVNDAACVLQVRIFPIRNGIRAPGAGRKLIEGSWFPLETVAIAQQPPHEFLTDARASASVNVCGATHDSRLRHAQIIPGERIIANAIITLTTDYGTNDHLVGTLKGVI